MKEKKILILESALRVFRQYGFHESKISMIAEEAGIGKGTVYEYFDSKKEIYEETIFYTADIYLQEVERIILENHSIRERLIAIAKHLGNFTEKNMGTVENLIRNSNILSQETKVGLLEIREKLYNALSKTFSQWEDKLEIRDDLNSKMITMIFLGMMKEFYEDALIFNKEDQGEIEIEDMIDVLLEGISKK
ncbi:TetR/AcrR family transcriptional regulator [Alkaliphilus metalliredigens]|nr:TetR/AcrR family transcriptional regulator [Alkaliphilus metalliredigens]